MKFPLSFAFPTHAGEKLKSRTLYPHASRLAVWKVLWMSFLPSKQKLSDVRLSFTGPLHLVATEWLRQDPSTRLGWIDLLFFKSLENHRVWSLWALGLICHARMKLGCKNAEGTRCRSSVGRARVLWKKVPQWGHQEMSLGMSAQSGCLVLVHVHSRRSLGVANGGGTTLF